MLSAIKRFIIAGIVFIGTAVVLGAFASHGLKHQLSESALNVFQIGVQYQFYHGLGLVLVALLMQTLQLKMAQWAGWLFIFGILFFSGSLYALALSGSQFFGPITPIGGLCFIAGWLILCISAIREFK